MASCVLRERTKAFALHVIELVGQLPDTIAGRAIGRQLCRSGTSVGANYRAAERAKSRADFISKMGTVEEEADESMYWMELLSAAAMVPSAMVEALLKEADEIVAMTVSSVRTARAHHGAGR